MVLMPRYENKIRIYQFWSCGSHSGNCGTAESAIFVVTQCNSARSVEAHRRFGGIWMNLYRSKRRYNQDRTFNNWSSHQAQRSIKWWLFSTEVRLRNMRILLHSFRRKSYMTVHGHWSASITTNHRSLYIVQIIIRPYYTRVWTYGRGLGVTTPLLVLIRDCSCASHRKWWKGSHLPDVPDGVTGPTCSGRGGGANTETWPSRLEVGRKSDNLAL
jgi:hypothetical protein